MLCLWRICPCSEWHWFWSPSLHDPVYTGLDAPVELLLTPSTMARRHHPAAGLRRPVQCRAVSHAQQLDRRRGLRQGSTCTYPEPETEKERSSVDFPQVTSTLDWEAGPPSSASVRAHAAGPALFKRGPSMQPDAAHCSTSASYSACSQGAAGLAQDVATPHRACLGSRQVKRSGWPGACFAWLRLERRPRRSG